MIYVTGDTHGLKDIAKFSSPYFLEHINKEGNYVIITGDSGVTWNEESMKACIKYFSKFKCTFLFVDGNNDNFDILNKLPVSKFKGGNVHIITSNLIHLMRGNIFTIENKTFLAFGGADSWDAVRKFAVDKDRYYNGKGRRFEHENWWEQERPSKEELKLAIKNLKEHNNKVDVILTHETTTKNVKEHFDWSVTRQTCKMLDLIYRITDFKMWFFGHHHHDIQVSKVERCMFDDFVKVDNLENMKYKSQYKNLEVQTQKLTEKHINESLVPHHD